MMIFKHNQDLEITTFHHDTLKEYINYSVLKTRNDHILLWETKFIKLKSANQEGKFLHPEHHAQDKNLRLGGHPFIW